MNYTLIPTLCMTMKRWFRFQSWGWLANPFPFPIKTKLKKPIQEMWYIYTMELLCSDQKEWNIAICSNMDGTGGYYAEWNKSIRERHVSYDHTDMRNS